MTDARGKPVKTVGEVDGVGDADDPQQRKHHPDGSGQHDGIHPGQRYRLDAEAEQHGGDRDDGLGKQLHPRPDAVPVVDDPEQDHTAGAGEQAVDVEAVRAKHLPHQVVQPQRDNGSAEDHDEDDQPPHRGRRSGVLLPAEGVIHPPEPPGDADVDRGRHGRADRRGGEKNEIRVELAEVEQPVGPMDGLTNVLQRQGSRLS
jgi:hypothetical protein